MSTFMRKTINLNEDLNGQPFRHLTSFLFLLCIFRQKKQHSYLSSNALNYHGLP